MSYILTITDKFTSVPFFAVVSLASVFFLGLFIIGYDQGQIFSLVQGEQAFVDQFLHEFAHDIRHAAGFPCH